MHSPKAAVRQPLEEEHSCWILCCPHVYLSFHQCVFTDTHTCRQPPHTQFQEALRDHSTQQNLSRYLSKCQNLLTSPGTAAEPFCLSQLPWGSGQLRGTFGFGKVVQRFWVAFATWLAVMKRRGVLLSEPIYTSRYFTTSLVWECSCLVLRPCALLLLSQKASCSKQMNQRVEGEHRGVGSASPPHLAGIWLCWSSTQASRCPPQHLIWSISYLFLFCILKCIWWTAVAEDPRPCERLWCAVEDWSVKRVVLES